MSGAVVEMYIKNQIEHSIGLGRLSKLLIYWIVANLPNIKDIHLTALGKNKDHITILFNDCSRVHWWYNHEQTFMLPDYFQGLRSDGTNYQAKTFMESTTKVPATNVTYKIYLLNHLYDEMKKNAKLYRDVKDLDEYVGDSLPLLSSQELNPYGSCIEDDELLLHYAAPALVALPALAAAAPAKEEDIRDRDDEKERDRDEEEKRDREGRQDDTAGRRGRDDRDGGKKFTRKSNKRKSHKRKSHKRKPHKRKSYKRKLNKRK